MLGSHTGWAPLEKFPCRANAGVPVRSMVAKPIKPIRPPMYWKSMGDLEKYREKPLLKAYRQRAGSLLAKPIEVTLFEMISEA
jgi:hypothetical protein